MIICDRSSLLAYSGSLYIVKLRFYREPSFRICTRRYMKTRMISELVRVRSKKNKERKGSLAILQEGPETNERDTILRRNLSTRENMVHPSATRRCMDADGDESAVAGKLAGRLHMNGTNVWGWSVASHYFTRTTGAGPAATRWSSNPCWPMDQPDNLCYLTHPLEICLWYMLGLEIRSRQRTIAVPLAQQFQQAIVSTPQRSSQFHWMFTLYWLMWNRSIVLLVCLMLANMMFDKVSVVWFLSWIGKI